jgi:hypothetical protein
MADWRTLSYDRAAAELRQILSQPSTAHNHHAPDVHRHANSNTGENMRPQPYEKHTAKID